MYGAPPPDTIYGPTSCGGCQSGYDDTTGEYQAIIQTFQSMLQDLGYLSSDVRASGFYGTQTYRAVQAFQQDYFNDSDVDGRIGPTTARYIISQHSASTRQAQRQAGMAAEGVSQEQITEIGDQRQQVYQEAQRQQEQSLKGKIQKLPKWVLPTAGGVLLLGVALIIRRRRR